MDRICVNETLAAQAEGDSKLVRCGHAVSLHDSGGCCKAQWCPCSRLVLSPQDEFDATEPKGPKSIP